MINMHTKFEVSSLSRSRDILRGPKVQNGSRDVATPISGRFVIRRLGLATFNPHIKSEMSTITWNKETKGNAKCKNSRFEPPFGGLRGDVHGSSMARCQARGRLPISANWIFLNSSHRCSTIKRNLSKSAFSEGVGRPPTNVDVRKLESLGYHVLLFAWSYV